MAATPWTGTVFLREKNSGDVKSYPIAGDDLNADFVTWPSLGAAQTFFPVSAKSGGMFLEDIQLSSSAGDTQRLKAVIDGDQKPNEWRRAQLTNFNVEASTRVGRISKPIAPGSSFQLQQLT